MDHLKSKMAQTVTDIFKKKFKSWQDPRRLPEIEKWTDAQWEEARSKTAQQISSDVAKSIGKPGENISIGKGGTVETKTPWIAREGVLQEAPEYIAGVAKDVSRGGFGPSALRGLASQATKPMFGEKVKAGVGKGVKGFGVTTGLIRPSSQMGEPSVALKARLEMLGRKVRAGTATDDEASELRDFQQTQGTIERGGHAAGAYADYYLGSKGAGFGSRLGAGAVSPIVQKLAPVLGRSLASGAQGLATTEIKRAAEAPAKTKAEQEQRDIEDKFIKVAGFVAPPVLEGATSLLGAGAKKLASKIAENKLAKSTTGFKGIGDWKNIPAQKPELKPFGREAAGKVKVPTVPGTPPKSVVERVAEKNRINTLRADLLGRVPGEAPKKVTPKSWPAQPSVEERAGMLNRGIGAKADLSTRKGLSDLDDAVDRLVEARAMKNKPGEVLAQRDIDSIVAGLSPSEKATALGKTRHSFYTPEAKAKATQTPSPIKTPVKPEEAPARNIGLEVRDLMGQLSDAESAGNKAGVALARKKINELMAGMPENEKVALINSFSFEPPSPKPPQATIPQADAPKPKGKAKPPPKKKAPPPTELLGVGGSTAFDALADDAEAKGEDDKAKIYRGLAIGSSVLLAGALGKRYLGKKGPKPPSVTDLVGKGLDNISYIRPVAPTKGAQLAEVGPRTTAGTIARIAESGQLAPKTQDLVDYWIEAGKTGITKGRVPMASLDEAAMKRLSKVDAESIPDLHKNAIELNANKNFTDTEVAVASKMLGRLNTLFENETDEGLKKLAHDALENLAEVGAKAGTARGRGLNAMKMFTATDPGVWAFGLKRNLKNVGVELTDVQDEKLHALVKAAIKEAKIATGLEEGKVSKDAEENLVAYLQGLTPRGFFEKAKSWNFFAMLNSITTIVKNIVGTGLNEARLSLNQGLGSMVGKGMSFIPGYGKQGLLPGVSGSISAALQSGPATWRAATKGLSNISINNPEQNMMKRIKELAESGDAAKYGSSLEVGPTPLRLLQRAQRGAMEIPDAGFQAHGIGRALPTNIRNAIIDAGGPDVNPLMKEYVGQLNPKQKGWAGFITDFFNKGDFDYRVLEKLPTGTFDNFEQKILYKAVEDAIAEGRKGAFKSEGAVQDIVQMVAGFMDKAGLGTMAAKRKLIAAGKITNDITPWDLYLATARNLDTKADLGLGTGVLPFKLVPTNMIMQFLEATMVAPFNPFVQTIRVGKKLLTRQALTQGEKMAFEKAWGDGIGLAALAAAGYHLMQEGKMTFNLSREETRARAAAETAGEPVSSAIKIGDGYVDVKYLNPIWGIAKSDARLAKAWDEYSKKKKEDRNILDFAEEGALAITTSLHEGLDMDMLQGLKSLIGGPGDKPRNSIERVGKFLGDRAGSFIPTSLYKFANAPDELRRDNKAAALEVADKMGFKDSVKDGLLSEMFGAVFGRLYANSAVMREHYTGKKDYTYKTGAFGEPLKASSHELTDNNALAFLASVANPSLITMPKDGIAADYARKALKIQRWGMSKGVDLENVLPLSANGIQNRNEFSLNKQIYKLTNEQSRELMQTYGMTLLHNALYANTLGLTNPELKNAGSKSYNSYESKLEKYGPKDEKQKGPIEKNDKRMWEQWNKQLGNMQNSIMTMLKHKAIKKWNLQGHEPTPQEVDFWRSDFDSEDALIKETQEAEAAERQAQDDTGNN